MTPAAILVPVVLLGFGGLLAWMLHCLRLASYRMLLAMVAQTAERHRLFYWVDFNTLHSLVHRNDAPDRNHTLSVLESPQMETLWTAFVSDLDSQGLFVRERRVTYRSGGLWTWCLVGYGSPYVQIMVYQSKGDEYVCAHQGNVPGWMIGATRFFFWQQAQCFLRLPAHEGSLLRWRFGSYVPAERDERVPLQ